MRQKCTRWEVSRWRGPTCPLPGRRIFPLVGPLDGCQQWRHLWATTRFLRHRQPAEAVVLQEVTSWQRYTECWSLCRWCGRAQVTCWYLIPVPLKRATRARPRHSSRVKEIELISASMLRLSHAVVQACGCTVSVKLHVAVARWLPEYAEATGYQIAPEAFTNGWACPRRMPRRSRTSKSCTRTSHWSLCFIRAPATTALKRMNYAKLMHMAGSRAGYGHEGEIRRRSARLSCPLEMRSLSGG